MTRSFLFAQDSADAATTRLIATAAEVTGFLQGEPGQPRPGSYMPGADNTAMLGALQAGLLATYPQAGPAFHAVRLWTNLLWQPAYLAVIAAHFHGAMPDLGQLSQQRSGIYVNGYRLVPSPQSTGTVEELIAEAGRQLKPIVATMLVEVNGLAKLKPLPARRLFADRMLSLMVWLGQRRPELSASDIERYCSLWLEALGLDGQGALEQVAGPAAQPLLIVKRKGCCLDYLVDNKLYCASCPKQEDHLRVARQTANAVAELG